MQDSIESVKRVGDSRRSGGYDIERAFSRDLMYGDQCCIKASRPLNKDPGPNPTMCVAAIAEVIVEALNIYSEETKDFKFTRALPMTSWSRGNNLKSIRANLFMFKGTGSQGTAYALEKLGLGRHKPFSKLQAGDFINFNRTTNTGHAVVFLGYIRAGSSTLISTFSPDVVGFRYFSAQGQRRPDGGFGYRNAYFSSKCPTPRGTDDDCNVIKGYRIGADDQITQNQTLLNSGELFAPDNWTVNVALAKLEKNVSRGFEDAGLTRGSGLEEAVRTALEAELQPDATKYEDGSGM